MIPENPVVGGTALRRQSIQSPNFVTGSTGWAINQDGSAEFNNVVIRNGTVISGTALYYTGAPGLGNLVASISPSGGTDPFGNLYLAGITNYQGGTLAIQFVSGQMRILTAPGAGGPWTTEGSISLSGTNLIFTSPPGGTFTAIGGLFTMNNGLTVNSGETVTGGISADTEVISSGQASAIILDIANTTTPAASALVRITTAGQGDLWLSSRVSGDTNPRFTMSTTAAGLWQATIGSGAGAADITLRRAAANLLDILTADLDIATVGRGLRIAEGTNARMGRSVLVAGTVVVSNTSVTAATEIFLTCNVVGGTPGFLRVSARTAGTSFTILSSSGTDTSTVSWLLVEPG